MRRVVVLGALALCACPNIPSPSRSEVTSIDVAITGLYTSFNGQRTPLAVATSCASQFDGGQAAVPLQLRGKETCR